MGDRHDLDDVAAQMNSTSVPAKVLRTREWLSNGDLPLELMRIVIDFQSSCGCSAFASSRKAARYFSANEPIEESSTQAATHTAAIVAPS